MNLQSNVPVAAATMLVLSGLLGFGHQAAVRPMDTSSIGTAQGIGDNLAQSDAAAKLDYDDYEFRTIPNNAFTVGEKLDYTIYYGPIAAGSATISVPSYQYYGSRKCYKIEFSMRSASFFDIFFKVRDYYSSLVDVQGLFPWKFEQHVREGGYKRDFVAEFNQVAHTAMTSDGGPYQIKRYTQDAVSAFFYARTLDYDTLKVGDEVHFSNFYNDKDYPLNVKYLGEQNVTTKAGKFHCQVIEPVIVKGGLFRNTGKITVWVSDDSLRVPVKVSTQVIIGSVDADLVHYSGLAGPLTSVY
ncbi:MAG: DUF3108 domain-containing protein [Bacteroidetes bacterium]|nr:DUF3108 domain-containing protein [Bacteroidota bacterium]